MGRYFHGLVVERSAVAADVLYEHEKKLAILIPFAPDEAGRSNNRFAGRIDNEPVKTRKIQSDPTRLANIAGIVAHLERCSNVVEKPS